MENQGEQLDWLTVVNAFHDGNSLANENFKANIVDSAFYDGPTAIKYLFTNADGYVAMKPMKCIKHVWQSFSSYFSHLDIPSDHNIALIKSKGNNAHLPISFLAFKDLCHGVGTIPANLEKIQLHVASKGLQHSYRTYRTSFWLDSFNAGHLKCDRLDVNASISGTPEINSVINQNRVANEIMETMCKALVSSTQDACHCRVLTMTVDFVQDVNGKIWLLYMNDCSVSYSRDLPGNTILSPATRKRRALSAPASKYRQMRQAAAIDFGDRGSAQEEDHTSRHRRELSFQEQKEQTAKMLSQTRDTGFARSLAPYVSSMGKNTEERIQQRLLRSTNVPPDENLVNQIMEETAQRSGSAALIRSNSTRLLSPIKGMGGNGLRKSASEKLRQGSISSIASSSNMSVMTTTTNGSRRSAAMKPLAGPIFTKDQSLKASLSSSAFRVSNARLSMEVPITESNKMFGSSQGTNNCQGDFCNFNIKYMEMRNPELSINNEPRQSPTRKPNASNSPKKGTAAMLERSTHLSDFRKRLLLCVDSGNNGKKGSFMSGVMKGSIEAEDAEDEEGAKPNDDSMDEGSNKKRITFKQIVQARQEMPLVKLLLKRHRNDEEGDYMSEKNYQDIAVGEVLPAHYYHEVPCCHVCFQIYQIIETARHKALRKIGRRKANHNYEEEEAAASNLSLLSFTKHQMRFVSPTARSSRCSSPISITPPPTQFDEFSRDNQVNVDEAVQALDMVTKEDIAEAKSWSQPHPAVKIVMEAVMCLLLGKPLTFVDIKKIITSGDKFAILLRDFTLSDVTEAKLKLVQPYVENPVFRPENVVDISRSGSNFCSWVLGVVQAAQWQRGKGHKRTNILKSPTKEVHQSQSSFAAKLKKNKETVPDGALMSASLTDSRIRQHVIKRASENPAVPGEKVRSLITREQSRRPVTVAPGGEEGVNLRHSATYPAVEAFTNKPTTAIGSNKQKQVLKAAQAKANTRLASLNDGGTKIVGDVSTFRCLDGITVMPYVTVGPLSLAETQHHNIVCFHDFFDTCDATSILFKPLVKMHPGCQVLCFNYPGQAHTVWPRPPKAERDRGAVEPVLNNDWIADRVDELLKHVESEGDILLSSRPFHIVGFGNGACIASAFAQRWGVRDPHYCNSIKSIISVNGFLAPDPQLTSVLHSASQIFESTPHNRPDVPVSYWSRFVFSEDYLQRINPNLALNMYTAVNNPITNDGRSKIAKGCMQHRDLRGGLSPDLDLSEVWSTPSLDAISSSYRALPQYRNSFKSVNIPVIILQSTENSLVNASNVDSFLTGRTTKHLWSHQQNVLSDAALSAARDTSMPWVGGLSSGPQDYAKYSILGRNGLKMLVETMKNPRGAFVMWTRSGHIIQQENKTAVLDLFDAMICPTDEYTGLAAMEMEESLESKVKNFKNLSRMTPENSFAEAENLTETMKMDVLFKIGPPQKVVIDGRTLPFSKDKEIGTVVDDGTLFERKHVNSPKKPQYLQMSPSDINAQKECEIEENSSIDEATGVPQEMKVVNNAVVQSITEENESSSHVGELAQEGEHTKTSLVSWSDEVKDPDVGETSGLDSIMDTGPRPIVMKKLPKPDFPAVHDHVPVRQIAAPAPVAQLTATSERSQIPATPQPSSTVPATPQPSSTVPATPQPSSTVPATPQASSEVLGSDKSPAIQSPDVNSLEVLENVNTPTPVKVERINTPTQVKVSIGTVDELLADDALTVSETPVREVVSEDPKEALELKEVSLVEGETIVEADPVVYVDNPKHPQFKRKHQVPREKEKKKAAFIPMSASDVVKVDVISNVDERANHAWTEDVPPVSDALSLEVELAQKHQEFSELLDRQKKQADVEAANKNNRLITEQQLRQIQYAEEDKALLEKLQTELVERRRQREVDETQRRVNLQFLDEKLVECGVVEVHGRSNDGPVKDLAPMRYSQPAALPQVVTEKKDANTMLDQMLEDEENARKRGELTTEDYEKVKRQMAARQIERDQKLRHLGGEEQHMLFDNSAVAIQRTGRGYNGRKRFAFLSEQRRLKLASDRALIKAQALTRGMLARIKYEKMKMRRLQAIRFGESTLIAQRVWRGFVGRRVFRKARRNNCTGRIQRTYRGYLGRVAVKVERDRLALLLLKLTSAKKVQSVWRMKVAREEFRSLKIHMLAVLEIQRMFRGFLGRKAAKRKRVWDATPVGPERIKLGLTIINESKLAFERQQEEIDALHRAQERVESRVSHIRADLEDSNREIVVLERELQEIDHIERDLVQLTHERDLLTRDVRNAAGVPNTADAGLALMNQGQEPGSFQEDPDASRRRRAEAYALEMTIQIKRAEREKRKRELDTEFATVFQDVEKKKKALARLEVSLADMESTRERKDREFRRLQKNLTQLLLEQKQELDDLREKGIELETATATTAAAATATAYKAREHEKQSATMFSQTEELMKFQFMSMSLSYFSSLNMLKQLRDMNADTTSAAIASSADAAAAAAASATAANLPSVKKLDIGANDVVELNIQKKKAALEVAEAAERDAMRAKEFPQPDNVRLWTVADVSRWLESLSLSQYITSFKDGTVDGPFLMELKEEDIVQVLGVQHKLHVRKILTFREKLKPLSEQEETKKQAVEREDQAEAIRKTMGIPNIDTVFSQARNGRINRVEESLNLGFDLDSEDEKGNTLLTIAAQNSNRRLLEKLVIRGAKVNHQTMSGNTALHFALAFDPDGGLGEYLIEHGADDTLTNSEGLCAYDGLAGL